MEFLTDTLACLSDAQWGMLLVFCLFIGLVGGYIYKWGQDREEARRKADIRAARAARMEVEEKAAGRRTWREDA